MQEEKKHLLSCGSTMGNLGISGKWSGAFMPGCYYSMPGDSDSGKTWVAISTLAEAANNPFFDKHELIYANPEDGVHFDIGHYFGKKAKRRIREPFIRGEERAPETVEEFYDMMLDEMKKNPIVLILDSMDALVPEAEKNLMAANKRAREKGREIGQSYGTDKARLNSKGLRAIARPLKTTGSILIIISQAKDMIGGFGFGERKTRAGGKALKFFCQGEIWTSQIGEIKKQVTGTKINEQIGIKCRIKVKRSRQTGQHRTVDFPIYHSYGIDDMESCIDFLVKYGHWKSSSAGVKAKELDFVGTKRKLIQHIEENDLERTLRVTVGKKWKAINEELQLKRKKRYI